MTLLCDLLLLLFAIHTSHADNDTALFIRLLQDFFPHVSQPQAYVDIYHDASNAIIWQYIASIPYNLNEYVYVTSIVSYK